MEEKETIMPVGANIIVVYPDNPYEIRKTDSGLYVPDGLHKSSDSGRMEMSEQFIKYAKVVEVGGDVKFLKKDDGVFVDVRAHRPIPYLRVGYHVINEGNVLSYIRK